MRSSPVTHKLHKMLAQEGLGSRRNMEALIESGRVTVNGKIAAVGARVSPKDEVRVDKRIVKLRFIPDLPRILIYHKPEGEIVSRADPEGRPSVFDKLPRIQTGKWIAVGRLDYNTSGLLIFTDSGELANRLMHPRFEVEREYAVRIRGDFKPEHIKILLTGIKLEDGEAKFEILEAQGGESSNRWYRVVVREGRNRLVRRMFEALGFTVSRLMRVRFGEIRLPSHLKRGKFVELHQKQAAQVSAWAEREKF